MEQGDVEECKQHGHIWAQLLKDPSWHSVECFSPLMYGPSIVESFFAVWITSCWERALNIEISITVWSS